MTDKSTVPNPEEVVQAFFDALNDSGPEAAGEYLAETYTQQSEMPVQSRDVWIERQRAMLTPFPDLQEDFEILCVNDNVVHGINQITGTHKGDFDLSQMGIGIISATGRRVTAVNSVAHTVENGKIISSVSKPVANMGLPYILAQLGVKMP